MMDCYTVSTASSLVGSEKGRRLPSLFFVRKAKRTLDGKSSTRARRSKRLAGHECAKRPSGSSPQFQGITYFARIDTLLTHIWNNRGVRFALRKARPSSASPAPHTLPLGRARDEKGYERPPETDPAPAKYQGERNE
jgi:hypothetical protein